MPRLRRNRNHSRQDVTKSVGHFIAHCGLRRAARPCHTLHRPGPAIVGFILPEGAHLGFYETAAIKLANKHSRIDSLGNRDTAVLTAYDQASLSRYNTFDFADAVTEFDRVVVVAESESALPDDFDLVADTVVKVEPVTARDVIASIRVCFRTQITEEQAEAVTKAPLAKVAMALRPGRNVAEALNAIQRLQAKPEETKRPQTEGPALDDLFGLGEAGEWGRELAADFEDWKAGRISWSDVDCGILASGPPGTGKTTFAKALAKTCNVHVELGSVARWQAKGHLGDMLKAMRKVFEEARKNAPAIVFLDEIDAVGDRNRFSGHNADYSTQVVAALLECIDGAEGREGVVVVGACNYPDKLDAALVRPGRLDRHVRIPLPDANAREGIIRYHLRGELEDTVIKNVVDRTVGRTGAELEQLVREARRRARRSRRPMELNDMEKSLPPVALIPDAIVRRSAVHESGHVVVGIALGMSLERVTLMDTFDPLGPDTQIGGGAFFQLERLTERTREEFNDRICMGLGGLAAEEIMLGSKGAGGGGDPGSDLHIVTIDALRMEASYGLGQGLAYFSADSEEALMMVLRTNPDIQKRVNQVLEEQYRRAKEILTGRMEGLERLSVELFAKRLLSAEEVRGVIDGQPRLALVER